jgi:hypothetical protein
VEVRQSFFDTGFEDRDSTIPGGGAHGHGITLSYQDEVAAKDGADEGGGDDGDEQGAAALPAL